MGAAHSIPVSISSSSHCLSLYLSNPSSNCSLNPSTSLSIFNPYRTPRTHLKNMNFPLKSKYSDEVAETQKEIAAETAGAAFEPHAAVSNDAARLGLVDEMVYEALVWSSLHGLVVGDRNVQRSGIVPGIGMVHAPTALLPMPFPEDYWRQACELAPIFNELVDRVSLDGKFLQDSLSRTKKVDTFTSRLLDIHSKMLEINKMEDIRLGLHRSDYMLDAETNLLFQIELNTISSSFPGLTCLVSELHRNLLNYYGKHLGLDSRRVPRNAAVSQFAEALAKAWKEYNNNSAAVLVVVQSEERNMYDQHWLSSKLKESHGIASIRKTLAEIDAEGEVLPDGSLLIGGKTVAVVYFRAGYSPNDYPSESVCNILPFL